MAKRKVKRKKTKTKRKVKKTKTKTKRKTKRKSNAKFMAPLKVSATLAAVVGKGPMPRTEVTKKLWAYIKRKKLQDKKNKRNINPDAALGKVFGSCKSVNMFKMTKLVSKHLS